MRYVGVDLAWAGRNPTGLAALDEHGCVTSLDMQRVRSESVEHAGTKAMLRRTEDQVDALVCAYVALVADHSPERVRILGDTERGYIVTPVAAHMARRIDAESATFAQPF